MARYRVLIDRIQDDLLVVANLCEEDIPVGTTFTSLSSQQVEGEDRHLEPEADPQIVSLEIRSVEKFSHSLIEIPLGYSAGIRVSGSGLELIREHLTRKTRDTMVILEGD